MNLAWGTPGIPELLIILFVVLLLFGGKKLPGLSRALGRSLGEFKKGKQEGEKKDAPAELEDGQEDRDEGDKS